MPQVRLIHGEAKELQWWALLLALLLLQTGLVLYLASPYRLFPSDDLNYYVDFMRKKGGLFSLLQEEQHPFFLLFFLGCARLGVWLKAPLGQVFIISSLIANGITLTSLTLITRHYTQQLHWAALAGLLFITSAWSNNYYFFFSYTPLPTALLILALACGGPSHLQPALASGRGRYHAFLAGTFLGLAFWSAPAALIMIGLLLPLPLLLHLQAKRQRGIPLCRWQIGGFLATFIPFFLSSFAAYIAHIQQNIGTSHYDDALEKFGYIPTPPFFTFLRILWEYSWLQTGLTLAVSGVLGYYLLRHYLGNRPAAHQGNPRPLPEPLFFSGILLALCLVHPLAIDLLPSTKLGRTHFQIFPLILLLLVIPPASLLARIPGSRPRKIAQLAYSGLLVLSLALAANKSLETRFLRFAAPEYLATQEAANIYLLQEDPHAEAIASWLNDTRVGAITERQLASRIAQETKNGIRGMLILGPTGPGSGNTILQHSTMADFNLTLPEPLKSELIYLPYYSFHPPFLFEEEICEALYWQGKIPSQETPESSLKIVRW